MATRLTNLIGFMAGGGAPLEITPTDIGSSTTNQTTYTFTSRDLGTADAGRYIAVCIVGSDSATNFSVSTVTIGGVSAALVAGAIADSDAGTCTTEIWIANVPTGATGDVVVTWSEAVITCAISVYHLLNLGSTTPHDVATDNADFQVQFTLDVPAGGGIIAAATVRTTGSEPTPNWSDLTQDTDIYVDETTGDPDVGLSTAHEEFAAAQSALTFDNTWGGSPGASTSAHGVAVSFAGT